MTTLRAGTRRSRPLVVIEGDEMNFLKQFRRLSPRFYPFSSIDSVVTKGQGTSSLNPPSLEIGTGTVTAPDRNFRTIWFENNQNDQALGDGWYTYAYHVRGRFGPAQFGGGASGSIAGIGIGHPYDDNISQNRPPWDDPSDTTWCRFFYDFDSDTFKLQSTPGNGIEATATESIANPYGSLADFQASSALAELVYDPHERAVYALLHDTEILRIDDEAKLPRFDGSGVIAMNYSVMANIFVESGAVNGMSAGCFFTNFICWNPDRNEEGATMW